MHAPYLRVTYDDIYVSRVKSNVCEKAYLAIYIKVKSVTFLVLISRDLRKIELKTIFR